MKQHHVANISMLIHFMEKLTDPSFDMSCYMHGCGSPACALGWACTVPALQGAGLSTEKLESPGRTVNMSREVFGCFSDLFADRPGIKTPQQWAQHAREYLREHGQEVVSAEDGFKAFMEKVLVAVALERERA